MQPLYTYNVIPKLPATLEPLRDIVYNLWWTWEPSARKLFRHLDPNLWNQTNHNPLRMLQLSKQARLLEVAEDDDFLRELKGVHQEFKAYMARPDTYGKLRKDSPLKKPISLRNSGSTNPCRIIPAASASSPATIANRQAISG
jgi:starch phosphorylase